MFALVDCNNFYATCERLFRPDLNGKPIIVLSNNDGCVVARSAEAKAIGIKMGVPAFQITEAIRHHGIEVFSSNYSLYADMSNRVMRILEGLAPSLEIYSIDEAFLDVRGIRDLQEFGERVRRTIRQWTGIAVSVGIAQTKSLAKIATHGAKKFPATGGVVVLTDQERQRKLMGLIPVNDVWGIGRKLTQHLKALGIRTALDLAGSDVQSMRRRFNVVVARTISELQGVACLELEQVRSPKKEIVSSRSFSKRITTLEDMRQAVSQYTERACAKLRGERQFARSIGIFIHTSPFATSKPGYSNFCRTNTPFHTNDTLVFCELSRKILEKIWREGFEYNRAGVMLSDFSATQRRQRTLFDLPEKDNGQLMAAIDHINNTVGSIHIASSGIHQPWAMKREKLSPAYTTRWHDLPKVT